MACATLKRAYEWDPLNSPSQSGPSNNSNGSSGGKNDSPHSMSYSHRPSKRRCLFAHQQNLARATPPKQPSPFIQPHFKISPEDIALSIKEEMKRLHNRRQLFYTNNPDSSSPAAVASSSSSSSSHADSAQNQDDSHTNDFASTSNLGLSSPSRRDQPLFTFRQVNLICERLLKERETYLRDEYDQVLSSKLAEQYDTFVKFTYDQLQKRFDTGSTPSYLS